MPGLPSIAGLSVNNGVKFECTKVICIVRNPIDTIVDLAKLYNPVNRDFDAEWWTWFVTEQIDLYNNFFSTLVTECA